MYGGHAMLTAWGEKLDKNNILPEYPRPQMRRDSYYNLNGEWDYAITAADRYGRESHPRQMEKPQRMTRKVMPAWWYVTHPNG